MGEQIMNTKPVVLITGTSTGIGLSAAIYLARHHFQVVATMRDTQKSEALRQRAAKENVTLDVQRLDVQDETSIRACVEAIMQKYGRLDVLVNNAGSGFVGSTEQTSMPQLQRVLDVDFVGVWRCTQAALPIMRKARAGRIISVTSIGGLIGQPFNDAYCAAKFAVEGMMESLAPVAKQMGIHVSLIEPGPVNTEFVATATKGMTLPEASNDEYGRLLTNYIRGSRQNFATLGQTGDDIAAVIVEAATAESPHLRYLTSDAMRAIVAKKYVDLTSDSIVTLTGSRLADAK
jgi:NAD(P)-dependent dehydrogenase (short-subunit alcohol dehydrogenase family)